MSVKEVCGKLVQISGHWRNWWHICTYARPFCDMIVQMSESGLVGSKHGNLGHVVRARGAGSPTDRWSPLALSLSVPPGFGPVDLLNAVRAPFHVHPPHSYAVFVVHSHLSPKRAFSGDQRSVGEPAPRARTTWPRLPTWSCSASSASGA